MANVRKRGNKYTITVNYGVDIAGKQLRKYVTFAPDPKMTPKQQKKALEKFVVEFEEKVKNGEVLDGKTISLIDFYYKWLEEYVKISLEPTTVQWYQSLFEKKILPALGHLKMSEIKPFNLQTFYNSLSKEGARDDGGAYSPTSVKNIMPL